MSDRAAPSDLLKRLRGRLRPAFERTVADPTAPVGIDLHSDAPTLLVAFGGIQGGIGMPPFEFFRITSTIRTKRLFLRDLRQAWYHEGLPGYASTFTELAAALSHMAGQHRFDRLVATGVSAGGYAALAFGTLLGADRVLAFSPQTVITLDAMWTMGDHRFDKQLVGLAARKTLDPQWADLRAALPSARCVDTLYELHFDPESQLDRAHAERLAGLEGVHLVTHPGIGHNIPRALRASGELRPLLTSALRAGHAANAPN